MPSTQSQGIYLILGTRRTNADLSSQCDENLPACSQCVSRGYKCPGPITGPVFVSMNPKAKHKVVAKRDRVDRRQKPNIPSNDAMNILSSSISDVSNIGPSTVPQLAKSYNQLLLPSSYQPSRAAPFQELFLGHFISTFNNRNLQRTSIESWYEELPRILNTSQYQTVIDSIRAVTMVHYGVITANMPVQTEAYRWYAKALKGQRIVVQKDWQGLSGRMPAGEEVLPPILFALFELVTLTTPTGFAEHIVAAAALLQLRKPENCQDGLAHLLFRTVRISLVCRVYLEYLNKSSNLILYRYTAVCIRKKNISLQHIHGLLYPSMYIPKHYLTDSLIFYS